MNSFLAALLLIPVLAARSTTVSLDARGTDVREALATLFAQAKRPYLLDSSIRGTVYMSFSNLPYEKAIALVSRQTGLEFKDKEGIVLVVPAKEAAPKPVAKVAKATKRPETKPTPEKPTLNREATLALKVTIDIKRATIDQVFRQFSDQIHVEIVLQGVPTYRLDATFKDEPLGKALDQVCNAMELRYGFSQGKIVVTRR